MISLRSGEQCGDRYGSKSKQGTLGCVHQHGLIRGFDLLQWGEYVVRSVAAYTAGSPLCVVCEYFPDLLSFELKAEFLEVHGAATLM